MGIDTGCVRLAGGQGKAGGGGWKLLMAERSYVAWCNYTAVRRAQHCHCTKLCFDVESLTAVDMHQSKTRGKATLDDVFGGDPPLASPPPGSLEAVSR